MEHHLLLPLEVALEHHVLGIHEVASPATHHINGVILLTKETHLVLIQTVLVLKLVLRSDQVPILCVAFVVIQLELKVEVSAMQTLLG